MHLQSPFKVHSTKMQTEKGEAWLVFYVVRDYANGAVKWNFMLWPLAGFISWTSKKAVMKHAGRKNFDKAFNTAKNKIRKLL